jgi:hypothetical protein
MDDYAVSILSRLDNCVVIYDSDNRFDNYHPVQIIELAMIHPEPASIRVASGKFENPGETIGGAAAILKFNPGDTRQVASSKSAV